MAIVYDFEIPEQYFTSSVPAPEGPYTTYPPNVTTQVIATIPMATASIPLVARRTAIVDFEISAMDNPPPYPTNVTDGTVYAKGLVIIAGGSPPVVQQGYDGYNTSFVINSSGDLEISLSVMSNDIISPATVDVIMKTRVRVFGNA